MAYTSLLSDYMGSGLAAARPAGATLGPTIPTGSTAFYWATDTSTLYALPGGTTTWGTISGGGGGGGFTLIGSATATGGETSLTVSSIPGTYHGIKVVVIGQCNNTNFPGTGLRFNSDSGANYDYNFVYAAGAVTNQTATELYTTSISPTGFSDAFFGGTYDMPNYAGSAHKLALGSMYAPKNSGGVTDNFAFQVAGKWRNTAAITSASYFAATDSFKAGSSIQVFGY